MLERVLEAALIISCEVCVAAQYGQRRFSVKQCLCLILNDRYNQAQIEWIKMTHGLQ